MKRTFHAPDPRFAVRLRGGWCLLILLGLAGCQRDVQISTAKSELDQRAAARMQQDHVSAALELMDDYDRHQQELLLGRVLYHLRKWTESQSVDVDWVADPMFGRLPDRLGVSTNPLVLARRDFQREDVEMLRETRWLRDIAVRLSQLTEAEPRIEAWVQSSSKGQSADQRQALRSAVVIFDWLVRNIQIDTLWLDVSAGGAEAPDDASAGATRPESRPGIKRTAWEALLVGRGDALVRARLFILLLRQLDLPAVMVGVDAVDEPPPWGVGVLIGQEMYLFDAEIGLPLLQGPEPRMLTWSEVIADPERLSAWAEATGKAYPVQDGTLLPQVALIDATPQYLSQRMRLLELALPSDFKMVLTHNPSELRRRLGALPGLDTVRLWSQAYDVDAFRRSWQRFPQVIEEWQQEMTPLSPPWPLAFARRQHLRGIYFDPEREEGAKQLYLQVRPSDAQVQSLQDPRRLEGYLKTVLGDAFVLPEDPQVLLEMSRATQQILIVCRGYASYWMGLIAYETGNFRVASDYLIHQVLNRDSSELWRVGASYNLGRCYEAMGTATDDTEAFQKAIEYFEQDLDSPQGPGNRWRAQQLRQSMVAEPPNASAAQ